ncbi:MAG: hypothetical protein ACD_2C00001G0005 [uncultured bacterium (gcode 4)]|uniref:Uncharacterized protein n=1 Tax=uncultured bacterium (gcode 4) TaxID=1234023 RepID=K2H397_9BACT|nr:MAG: hypothetical protein ACD_2C00001G0005 [uncultured bacterium (gcode 4)]
MPYKFLNELPLDDLLWKNLLTQEEADNELEITKMQDKYLNQSKDSEIAAEESKLDKRAQKENRVKYCKIYFLWSLWQADKDYRNEGFSVKWSHTMIPSPVTWIWVVEAERYLMKNNWKIDAAYEEIRKDKWIEGKYQFIKINFAEFYNLFDEKKRNSTNKIVIIIIASILIFLIYTEIVNPTFLAEWMKHWLWRR